nr:MAG TPA: hypothetical protein [Caudoviricetes sp.]
MVLNHMKKFYYMCSYQMIDVAYHCSKYSMDK